MHRLDQIGVILAPLGIVVEGGAGQCHQGRGVNI